MDITTKEYCDYCATLIDCNCKYNKPKVTNDCNCEENCGCLNGGSCLCHEGRCKCHEKCKCDTVKVKCVNTTL